MQSAFARAFLAIAQVYNSCFHDAIISDRGSFSTLTISNGPGNFHKQTREIYLSRSILIAFRVDLITVFSLAGFFQ